MLDENTDVIAFTGHKALGALQGSGGFVLNRDAERHIRPFLAGGTGSRSESLEQPDFLPDKYESGTRNTLGILSLALAAEELAEKDLPRLREHALALTARFIAGAAGIRGLRVYGTGDAEKSLPLVSVSSPRYDCALLARDLYGEYGVIARPGLHCAPLAHRSAGSYPEGTLRFSFGPETREKDIDAALAALESLFVLRV
jgi:selenocysteine lyase/cysteine desulfurase